MPQSITTKRLRPRRPALRARERNAMAAASAGHRPPTTDETVCPDGVGRFNHFQRGSIYWYPQVGAFEVHGAIRGKWESVGWERSTLGYPTTDELPTPNGRGRFNHFQGGSIYWTPNTGAHVVSGVIRDEWAKSGWEAGPLGFPISDVAAVTATAGLHCEFEHGHISWTPNTGGRVSLNEPEPMTPEEREALEVERKADINPHVYRGRRGFDE